MTFPSRPAAETYQAPQIVRIPLVRIPQMQAAEGAVITRARRSLEPLTFIAKQLSGSPSEASPGKSTNAHQGKRASRFR